MSEKKTGRDTTLPRIKIISQKFDTSCGQWNKAVRALKIGNTYAEIWLHPEGDQWENQRPSVLKVLHPRHGSLQLFCPVPLTLYPGTYRPDAIAKITALTRRLEELTVYLQKWVKDFSE